MNVFEQIRKSYPISVYLQNKGFVIQKIGSGYQLEECPFCGGHDCFRVFASDKRWSCFQCSDHRMGKDVIDLEYYFDAGQSFGKAISNLCTPLGIESYSDELFLLSFEIKQIALDYYKNILFSSNEELEINYKDREYKGTALQYLEQLRKHSFEIIKEFQLGLSDGGLLDYLVSKGYSLKQIRTSGLIKNDRDLFNKNLILYPHFVEGKISHFTCKDPTKRFQPFQTEVRFRNEGWKFYNQDCLLDDEIDKSVLIVEGEDDLLSCVGKAKLQKVIATIGNLSEGQIGFLRGLMNNGWSIVMGFDGDEQGKIYRNTILQQVGGNIYDICIGNDGILEYKDIDDMLCESDDADKLMQKLLEKVESDVKLYKVAKATIKTSSVRSEDKMPKSLEHEQFIIKNLIKGICLTQIFKLIKNERIFYSLLHQKIFNVIKDLYKMQKDINELICYTSFKDMGIIKKDEEYDEIVNCGFESDIEATIEILQKKARRREYIKFFNKGLIEVAKEEIPIEDIEINISNQFFDLAKEQDREDKILEPKRLDNINLAYGRVFKLIGTPYEDLNESMVVGFDNGNTCIIAGRTGMGKSIFKANLKIHWCQQKVGVLDFCPENGIRMEMCRLDAIGINKEFKNIWRRSKGDLLDIECDLFHKRMKEENWALWHFEEKRNLDIEYILRNIKWAKKEREDIDNWIVIVDLADKIKEFRIGKEGWRAIEQGSFQLSAYSKEIGFCFVPIVQIGRGKEKEHKIERKRPDIADLRGSGNWEQDSDMVLLLFREKYYDSSIESDIIEIKLAKQRGGRVVTVEKLFNADKCIIKDYNIGIMENLLE